MSARMLEVSLLGVETVPRLERDAWSMVKRQRESFYSRGAAEVSKKFLSSQFEELNISPKI